MGTTISNVQVTKVLDGDTVTVCIDESEQSVRLACVDTEESRPGGSKPVTRMGAEAARAAERFFAGGSGGPAVADLEFDTDDDPEACLVRHRDNYGRLLCYAHKDGENFNLKLIREGLSPYFVKYGRSRVYHPWFTEAEAGAQAENRGVWDPEANAGGPSRDYAFLLPWWAWRAHIVEEYRGMGLEAGALSVRLDYHGILAAADANQRVTVLCDLQNGVPRLQGKGALVPAGTAFRPFNLWIPEAGSGEAAALIRLIARRYAGRGRGYVYAAGRAKRYRGVPELDVTGPSQLSDFPPLSKSGNGIRM